MYYVFQISYQFLVCENLESAEIEMQPHCNSIRIAAEVHGVFSWPTLSHLPSGPSGVSLVARRWPNVELTRRPKERFSPGTHNVDFIFWAMGCRFP